MLLQSYPFLLCCLIVHSIVLLFCISVVSVVFLFFDFFLYLDLLSFYLPEPCQRFVNFVYPFKEAVVSFIDFFFQFFESLFIYSLLDLYYLLLSADFRFCLFFFFQFFQVVDQMIYFNFFFSLKKAYIIMNFPLRSCFTDFNVQ